MTSSLSLVPHHAGAIMLAKMEGETLENGYGGRGVTKTLKQTANDCSLISSRLTHPRPACAAGTVPICPRYQSPSLERVINAACTIDVLRNSTRMCISFEFQRFIPHVHVPFSIYVHEHVLIFVGLLGESQRLTEKNQSSGVSVFFFPLTSALRGGGVRAQTHPSKRRAD